MSESLVGGVLGSTFVRRRVTIAPGDARQYREADWWSALVFVARGTLALECQNGGHREFRSGDILWMDGLDVRWLRNAGNEPTVLVSVSRRDPRAYTASE
jgi:quercetin dioxygenase-like cupin family protein